MAEPFDFYSDAFTITTTPWGANLSFQLRDAHPVPPSDGAPVERPTPLGTIRMSNEHLKVMVFMLMRQIKRQENMTGVQFGIPIDVLNQLGIPREDWDALWTLEGD